MATLFTRIVNGEIPCYKVTEDSDYLAFLDINPLAKGHTLVIPKKEIDYIFDIEDDLFAGLCLFAKKVAVAIEKSVTCTKVGIAVVGLEVPHAHIHLIPLKNICDLNFANPKLKFTPEEFKTIAAKINSNL
jgi:histidine triad (HIT) family protein